MDHFSTSVYESFNRVDRSSFIALQPTQRPLSVEPAALADAAIKSSEVDKATGRCICCHCELQYPELISRFRCPVCGTVNDLKPPLEKVCLQPPLTLRYFKQLVNECKRKEKMDTTHTCKELFYQPVEDLIDATFGNWMCLNDSFSNGNTTTTEDCGVALEDTRRMYKILLSLPINVIRVMMKATDKLLKRPTVPLRRMSDIRFLLIILENPLLGQHNFPAETKYHYNILQHVFGLLSCLNNECHHALVNWFSRYSPATFVKQVELVQKFMAHRITRALKSKRDLPMAYESDWKVASAARVMALLFTANQKSSKTALSNFYNTMVDYIHLMADFESWQSQSGKFAFCQYPFLISMGAKMQIMETDAKQQMEIKRREAFFNMLFHQRASLPYLALSIRRQHLIDDSLRQLVQHELDLKKSLRIKFVGEEGVDAGGLRKEWFLLLVRSLFDPQYGMFTYDEEEESTLCWFNPGSFENEDQFFLVGLVLGLAIYNSTILDIHLPLACYKKLLDQKVGLEDLAAFQPSLARGLQQLLSFTGDVESTFCRTFVVERNIFGERQIVPLLPGGENIMVTNKNRFDFVDLYVDYVLNKSVDHQFGAFQRGFYHICGGNALSLFRPEEIELLIRGSDQPLDIDLLRSRTEYHGFEQDDPIITYFWNVTKAMEPSMQRKLLMFVTGSDRIPATGSSQLYLQITCGGEDVGRLPSAHTCFNQLILYQHKTQDRLKQLLETAILESQGFYVK
ncbi:uncharacterized protein BX664DRAFT_334999 [Halteromyces radiatus]|uniref:uncharacterized protein n=1 Tax=Halteromyces radiatus TaxID=101107 RepID=UPI002221093B|nr:uncharacterized protein BX664DRAFT_334999 [Halteromyces radiatus]KAI8086138.1 hypothetical protein BX664DRAFT_334999 [Halteromyces radiatus]